MTKSDINNSVGPPESPHRPVLYHEIIHALKPTRGGLYVDATLGAGGHAWGILHASSPDGRLLGLDVDPQALSLARQLLAQFGERVTIVKASYATLGEQLAIIAWQGVDGILFDLGVSSMQLDSHERGFSFLADAPLDMRFDPEGPVSALDLVNTLAEDELSKVLFCYGEEQRARAISRAIINARPVETTRELAEVVMRAVTFGRTARRRYLPTKNAIPGRRRIHPATRTFQALRIAVNQELDALEAALPQALTALKPGGRLAVISFHSLEDRIVKQFIHRESSDCLCSPRQPVCTCGHRASMNKVVRRPIQPRQAEVLKNPRSRSARLRVAEKIG